MDAIPAQINVRSRTVDARVDGDPITAGTVNYYLVALTGANAGKWFRDADDTWQAAEAICGAMTHKADGHWTVSVAAAAWIDGVEYMEYAKESGDLHVPVQTHFRSESLVARIGTPIALDSGAATLAAMLTKMADDNGGATFDATTDSLNKIQTAVSIGAPTSHAASAQNLTQGTIDAGGFADTALANDTYFQLSPTGAGLDVDLTFPLGLNAIASSVSIEGYFDAHVSRFVNIYAWNYLTTAWDQISDAGSRMNHATSDADYGPFILLSAHQQDSDGEVKIRFETTSTTVGDNLYLDRVLVAAVVVGGFTLNDIAEAVAAHDVSVHMNHNAFGFRAALSMIEEYAVTVSNTATTFTCGSLPATANYYQYHIIRIHDVTNDRYADSWILSMDNAGVVILGHVLPFTPDTAAEMYVMQGQVQANIVVPDAAGVATGLHGVTDGLIGGLVVPDAAGIAAGLHGVTDGLIGGLVVPDAAGVAAALHAVTDGLIAAIVGDATAANQVIIIAYVDELETRLTAARAARLDADISSRATPANVTAAHAITDGLIGTIVSGAPTNIVIGGQELTIT